MNPDGSEQVNLTRHRADDQQAIWSPTGEKILFVSDRGGARNLYLMDPDGSNVQRVFKFKIEDWRTAPTWSPDGTQFAYERINWEKYRLLSILRPLENKMQNRLRMPLFLHGRQMEWN